MKPLAILSISVSEEEPTSVSFAAKEHTSVCLSVRLVGQVEFERVEFERVDFGRVEFERQYF